jgi:hypothetical protein
VGEESETMGMRVAGYDSRCLKFYFDRLLTTIQDAPLISHNLKPYSLLQDETGLRLAGEEGEVGILSDIELTIISSDLLFRLIVTPLFGNCYSYLSLSQFTNRLRFNPQLEILFDLGSLTCAILIPCPTIIQQYEFDTISSL